MTARVHEPHMAELSDLVTKRMGLCFPPERWRDLERAVGLAAPDLGFEDYNNCLKGLLESGLSQTQLAVLARHLTVGETYFFRERKSLEALEQWIFPELIRTRAVGGRSLRIWCAGCATGEEPYSIAVLLNQIIPNLADWRISLLATDINPDFLRKAEEATYTSWSFRDCPEGFEDRNFERESHGRLKLRPHLKRMVAFSHLNLAENSYPSLSGDTADMDLILCRNVLMYFSPEQAQQTVQRFYRCLSEGGWLLVSPCEASRQLFSEFAAVPFPGAMLYRKDSQRSVPAFVEPQEEPKHVEPPSPFVDSSIAVPEVAAFTFEGLDPSRTPKAVGAAVDRPSLVSYEDALALHHRSACMESVAALLTGLEASPMDADAMALLARAYANQGRLEEARGWCEKAISADRLRPSFHYLRGAILQEQGDERGAADALRRVLYLDHNFVMAHLALGNLRRRHGKRRDSNRHFRTALALLQRWPAEEPVPESEGMSSGRLMEIIQTAV